MAERTITSANSIFTLTVPNLYPVPVQLDGFAMDDMFSVGVLSMAEVRMGADGRLSAGYTPTPTPTIVTLQPDSRSIIIFEAIIQATKTAREIMWMSGSITYPSIGRSASCVRGVLADMTQLPSAKKVLEPMQYTIIWESINISVI